MKKHMIFGSAVVLLVICMVQMWLYFSLKNTAGNTMIVKIAEQKTLNFQMIENVTMDGIRVAALSYETGDVSLEWREQTEQVNIIRATSNSDEVMNIKMLKGSFFLKEAQNSNSAIISETLAIKLNKTIDCVGQHIIVEGETREICGVYAATDSLLSKIADNDGEDIFLNFEQNECPQYLLFDNDDVNTEVVCIEKLIAECGVNISNTNTIKTSTSLKLIKHFCNIQIFMVAMFVLLSIVVNQVIVGPNRLNRKGHIKRFIGIFVVIALMIVSVMLLSIDMPTEYLIVDNIFKIDKMVEILVNDVRKTNSYCCIDLERANIICRCCSFVIFFVFLITLSWYIIISVVRTIVFYCKARGNENKSL